MHRQQWLLNNTEPKHAAYSCCAVSSTINAIKRVLSKNIRNLVPGKTEAKAHYISALGYNLSRLENTKGTSEVETHPSFLWSHRERWRGLASFCDSSGHASCKRKAGIREGESEEDYDKQTSISSHFTPHPPPHITGSGTVCIMHTAFRECSATQQNRAMLLKGISKSPILRLCNYTSDASIWTCKSNVAFGCEPWDR